ncbi:Aste57867_14151 [Aphanomyces stellatus]|uniref:Aste57867_14151 protein n=1 Tax=Aphanomyces stellatus TaxID=120398 RepID=A0A485L267_9STRA|nr:hypothetical protein As57867_014100 [Aphanomyces stellatus]VFT90977.1 Aste57867_14151 [Aphanomyces stellatus]
MKSIVFVIASMLLAGVSSMSQQRADPNAINKCTEGVISVLNTAVVNPGATTCATEAGVTNIKSLLTGPKADDAMKILKAKSCGTWYEAVAASIVKTAKPCDFYDPKSGTPGKPSTSNTAKFKWSFRDFVREASKIKVVKAKPTTTVKPSATKPKTTAAKGSKPATSSASATTTAPASGTKATTATPTMTTAKPSSAPVTKPVVPVTTAKISLTTKKP